MRFLRRVIRAFREASRVESYQEWADQPGSWQAIDCHVLNQWFASDTGRRLKARLSNMVLRSAVGACAATTNGDYERGVARGIMLGVKALEAHMNVEDYAQPEEDFTSGDTQFANFEETAVVPTL